MSVTHLVFGAEAVNSRFIEFQTFHYKRIPRRTPRYPGSKPPPRCKCGHERSDQCQLIALHAESAMSRCQILTLPRRWRPPWRTGEPSIDQMVHAANVDAHCGGPQSERICVPSACRCQASEHSTFCKYRHRVRRVPSKRRGPRWAVSGQ